MNPMIRRATAEAQSKLLFLSRQDERIPRVNPDGWFGRETTEAVRAFQQIYGLPVTGVIDLDTWELLDRVYQEERNRQEEGSCVCPFAVSDMPICPGERSDAVSLLQLMLHTGGSEISDTPGVTGVYDTETENAVKKLQRENRMEETGIVDQNTWNALASSFRKNVSCRH